jgi:hypothetical protein
MEGVDDAGGSPGRAWIKNGTVLPDGQWNYLSPSDLQHTVYRIGSGTENLYAAAADHNEPTAPSRERMRLAAHHFGLLPRLQ